MTADEAKTLTEADVGKRVVNADGSAVGRIVDVEDGRGYVATDPGLIESIKTRIGFKPSTEDAHPLDEGSIERITDDAVYLRGTM